MNEILTIKSSQYSANSRMRGREGEKWVNNGNRIKLRIGEEKRIRVIEIKITPKRKYRIYTKCMSITLWLKIL